MRGEKIGVSGVIGLQPRELYKHANTEGGKGQAINLSYLQTPAYQIKVTQHTFFLNDQHTFINPLLHLLPPDHSLSYVQTPRPFLMHIQIHTLMHNGLILSIFYQQSSTSSSPSSLHADGYALPLTGTSSDDDDCVYLYLYLVFIILVSSYFNIIVDIWLGHSHPRFLTFYKGFSASPKLLVFLSFIFFSIFIHSIY